MMETAGSVQVFSDKYLENIGDAFKTLYNEEQLSDVTLYCKEGSLKAHKLILAASSPYFCKIFRENKNEFPILILNGTSLNQLKNLIDLVYSGITDVKNNDLEALLTLVRDFEIKGVNFGPNLSANNVRLEMNSSNVSPESLHNRDTRFKGQKRVAVDYAPEENLQTNLPSTSRADQNDVRLTKRANIETALMEDSLYVKREISSPAPTEMSSILSTSDITSLSDRSLQLEHKDSKLTAWAKKQRKFKCDLCPSSFKRSSHLSRHQLVHTGERPYSCDRCDKSFSRHDKLKNHIRKAHEYIPDSMYEKIDNGHIDSDADSNNITYRSPVHTTSDNDLQIEQSGASSPKNSPPLFTISHITSILEDSFVNPPKRARGRPRKYPPPNEEKIPEPRSLRKRKSVNNNEDLLFSFVNGQGESEKERGLFCQICDKPFVYKGRLKSHLSKIHGIIDSSQEETFRQSNVQNNNCDNKLLPNIGEGSIAISNLCSSKDSKEGVESTENLSYEQLKELLPEGCTLQPITGDDVSVTSQNDIQKKSFSPSPIQKKLSDADAEILIQGPHTFAVSSLLQSEMYKPIKNNKEKKNDVKVPKKNKRKKKKKIKRHGIVRYARSKKTKSKSNEQAYSQSLSILEENLPVLSNSVDAHVEESTTTPQLKMPRLSSAIEISLIPSNEIISSLPEYKKIGEDLSITVIGSSTEASQRVTNRGEIEEPSSSISFSDNNLADYTLSNEANPTAKPKTKSTNKLHSYIGNAELTISSIVQEDLPSFIPPKRKRGRPKKPKEHSVLIKKGRGRAKTNVSVHPERPGLPNYNITDLPYGDFDYLTSQTNTREEEEAVMIEPLVEINMDQSEQPEESEINQNMRRVEEGNMAGSSRMLEPVTIEPVVRIAEQNIKEECTDMELSHDNIDISEIETKIGLIGECTISVAN